MFLDRILPADVMVQSPRAAVASDTEPGFAAPPPAQAFRALRGPTTDEQPIHAPCA